jgi:predicted phosphodiesterase
MNLPSCLLEIPFSKLSYTLFNKYHSRLIHRNPTMFTILFMFMMIIGFNVATTTLRTAFASWKFVAVGDIECKSAKKVADDIKKFSNPAVVLLLGDLGYGKSSKCIKDAFPNGLPTVGNHDNSKDILKEFKIKKAVYSHTVKEVTFLSLNSDTNVSKQINSVKNLVAQAKTPFIIPFSHLPCVTNPSAHHGEWNDCKSKLVPILQQSGKTKLYVNGHNHGYQQCHYKGIDFVTSGTGGRKSYSWGNQMDDGCKNNISGIPGYLEVTVWDSHSMNGRFIDLKGMTDEDTDFSISTSPFVSH